MGPGLEDEVVENQADYDDIDQGANENDDIGGRDFAQLHGSGSYGNTTETSM